MTTTATAPTAPTTGRAVVGFAFASPAISATYGGGEWTIRREGKGDWLTFSIWGGFIYQSGGTEPVGRIYINDGPTSEAAPSWSRTYKVRCECGHGLVERDEVLTFATPAEAIEEAAFFYLS